MKKLFTLVTAGTLAVATLSAQAQVAVDGVLNTSEIGGTGGYVLIGKFTQARGFGNAGLLSLYAATTATKVTFFLGGTVEPNGNAFQLFFKTPQSAGVPAGTTLTPGSAPTFAKMSAKLDMATNAAVALRSATGGYNLEGITYYTSGTVSNGMLNPSPILGTGAPVTLSNNSLPAFTTAFDGARVAYRNTSSSGIDTNPGNTTPTTGASYGAAGSYGLELELDRAAGGITGNTTIQIFAVQNSGDGGYVSSDYIPQKTGPLPTGGTFSTTNDNLQANPDFSLVPGLQAATLNLTATSVTLGSRAAEAAASGLSVYPNPLQEAGSVTYQVREAATQVNIVLTDLLGRTVRTLESGLKSVGTQTTSVNAAGLAAGTYLVRVQLGDKVATSKVSVL